MSVEIKASGARAAVASPPVRVVEAGLRFLIAAPLLTVLVFTGFQHMGGVPAEVVLLTVTLPVAGMWAARKVTGLTMFNRMVVTAGLAALAASSDPGTGEFGQFAVFAGAAAATLITWIILISNRLTRPDPIGVVSGYWIPPVAALLVLLPVQLGVTEDVRFEASRRDLDRLVADVLATESNTRLAGGVPVSDAPTSVGLYRVEGVAIFEGVGEPVVEIYVAGSCGWHEDCVLRIAADGRRIAGRPLGDGWFANP